MIAPAVMFIEMGADMLKNTPEFIVKSQRKELAAFGDERAKRIGASGLSEDFQRGVELGLAIARAVIAMSPAAMKGGTPDQIL